LRRVAAVVLPDFRVALARASSSELANDAPLAVVVTNKPLRSLSGGTRIDEVSREARDYGVQAGSTIASAKAKCSDLRVRTIRLEEPQRSLEALAEMLLALGAVTSPLVDRDAVIVDVTGCAHLYENGEKELLSAITKAVARAGFDACVVIASGPEIAWAIARQNTARVVDDHESMSVLGALPIDVLRLEPSTSSYFYRLGVRTIAGLRALPRAEITARLDNANLAPRAAALLDGDDRTPIVRYDPPIAIEERVELEYGIEEHEALAFVLKPLCDRLSARLEGRCALASRLEIVLEMDRAMVEKGASAVRRVSLPLASPVRKSAELLTVLRSRFEREPPFVAPVLAIALRAPEIALAEERTRHLFVPESRAEIALPKLVAELSALLGEGVLGTLAVIDDWRIDHRSALLPISQRRPKVAANITLEPVRLFVSTPLAASSMNLVRLVRFDHVMWWRDPKPILDWDLAWSGDAITFVEVDASGRASVRGVLD
jgi:protein ImuB